MKNFSTFIICILICLAPTLMAGQALQVQNNLLRIPTDPQQSLMNTLQQSTDSSLLRLSALGPLNNMGISIELNSLSLSNPGPTLFLDCPDPANSSLGAIRLLPSENGSPLRISNIGSSGDDGVEIGFGLLDPLPFRPTIRLVRPSIFGPQSAIVLAPGEGTSHMIILNHDTTGNDGLSILIPPPSLLPPIFETRYDFPSLSESHLLADSHFVFGLRHTYDMLLPRLSTRIFHSDTLFVDSFFDISYDLSLHSRQEAFHHLHHTRVFQPSLLQLHDRVASDSAGVDSFFDVFYDISTGKLRRSYGDPLSELQFVMEFEKAAPKLLQRVQSTNPLFVDSFFDIEYNIGSQSRQEAFRHLHHSRVFQSSLLTVLDRIASDSSGVDSFFDVFYDISTGELRRSYGDPLSELQLVVEYEKATPKLSERIQSTEPLFVDSFFDITYDLSLASRREAFQDLHHSRIFQPSLLILHDRVASDLPGADSFFDVFFDISTGELRRSYGDPLSELQLVMEFEKATPKLIQRIQSTDPLFVDSFFDITYDLNFGSREVDFKELALIDVFFPAVPRFVQRFESLDPSFAGRFIEKSMEIQTELIPLELTSAGFPGLNPIEVRTEYDGLSRVIREESVDTDNGAVLLLERQLSLTGSTLIVGGNLQLNGGALSSTGPLDIFGPATVIGDLHVNGTLSADVKLFKIDHPLDPENKYLIHSCVESPDMMNVYNGNTLTDEDGYATIILPEYFDALNIDFRYQLTCIGQFAQAIVEEKINDNQFVIRTDKPSVEVSWQVTGIRNDPAAERQKYMVEVEKEPGMKGTRMYH